VKQVKEILGIAQTGESRFSAAQICRVSGAALLHEHELSQLS